MPVLDGYAATETIRQKGGYPDRHVTIVTMTANAMQGDREKCLAVGMDDAAMTFGNPFPFCPQCRMGVSRTSGREARQPFDWILRTTSRPSISGI